MSWLFWRQSSSQPVQSPPTTSSPSADTSSACPVDEKTRAVWLSQQSQPNPPHPVSSSSSSSSFAASPTSACSSDTISQSPQAAIPATPLPTGALPKNYRPLSLDREVSTIPRALDTAISGAAPSNSESDTGHDRKSGNWIYPSERQFFDAMRRKNFSPEANSIPSIIPIHNAVNERAWYLIKQWEGDRSESCGGPKLYSFQGLGAEGWNMSPKARFNSVLGYQAPFDRHDWVVERCGGEKVEYVIDFYQGRGSESNRGLNFYLDVRPKLNSWEGLKMRTEKAVGIS